MVTFFLLFYYFTRESFYFYYIMYSIKTNKIDSDFDSRVSKSIKFYLTIGVVSLFVNYLANVCWNTACERQIKKMR